MSGFLTEENRAFLKDRHLSEYALSSLDRGNGVIFYPEKINLMLDEARAPAVAAVAALQLWLDWYDAADGTEESGVRYERALTTTEDILRPAPPKEVGQ